MVDSSIDAPAFHAAATTAADASEKPLLRRSLSSEFFAGKGAMKAWLIYIRSCHILTVLVTAAIRAAAAAAAFNVPAFFFHPPTASRCA